jgi:hypothetical protein
MPSTSIAVPRILPDWQVLEHGAEFLVDREFNRMDTELDRLHNEFHDIASTLSLDVRHGYSTRYALDFDVIRSALDLHTHEGHQQFWSSVVIALGRANFSLFPGALFELKKYLSEKTRMIQGRTPKLFGHKLLEAVNLLRTDPVRGPYTEELQGFRAWDVARRDQYILRAVQDRLADDLQLPRVNRELFETAVAYLSRGTRVTLWENNRADAINYAILHCLNYEIHKRGFRYILVSNTRAMLGLDQAMRATFSLGNAGPPDSSIDFFRSGLVWTARTTALHQLLLRAGGGEGGAETIAFKILGNIADYRIRLAETRNAFLSSRSRRALPRLQDLLVDVVTEFDKIQLQLDRDIGSGPIMLEGSIYEPGDPEDFYNRMEEFVDRHLQRSDYGQTFSEQDASKSPLSLHAASDGERQKGFELRDELAQPVARFVEGEEVVLFTDCKVPVEEFLACVDTVQAMILSQVTLGQLRLDHLMDDDPRVYDDLVMVGIRGRGVIGEYMTSNSSYSLSMLAEKFECFPSDIHFVRIDGPLLSFSYEGDIIGIGSRYKLPREFETFLAGIVPPRYKSREFRGAISAFFRKTQFSFASVQGRGARV